MGISKKSSAALKHFLNSAVFGAASFVTLTYRYNMQDDAQAYQDLRKWYKRLCARSGGVCAVWRKELQERGAIHYHVFLLQPPTTMSYEVIRDVWLQVTSQEGDFASRLYGVHKKQYDLLYGDDAGVIVNYLVKYAAKDGQATKGKAWGILGRAHAKVREQRVVTHLPGAEYVAKRIIAWGGKQFSLEGGGVQYTLCFGHMGIEVGRGGLDDFERCLALVDEIA